MKNKRKNIVTIGGGTGSFTLLSGLKEYNLNLSAVVSMADDGGSTGVLRDELGVLPPGDARQCLVALSESAEILRELMNYRFEKGSLAGHSFGNLFVSALEKINGNFSRGIFEAGKILKIKGEVIPVSEGNMRLFIRLNNGKILKGENELDHNGEIKKEGIKNVFLKPRVSICEKAARAIKKADLIVIGPGDLWGSILPNLLVDGVKEAIGKSKGKVVFIANLTNKKGQTSGFGACDYARIVNCHLGGGGIDYLVFNTQKPPRRLLKKYEKKEGGAVLVQLGEKQGNYKVVKARLLNLKAPGKIKGDTLAATRALIRHDSRKLAKAIMELTGQNPKL